MNSFLVTCLRIAPTKIPVQRVVINVAPIRSLYSGYIQPHVVSIVQVDLRVDLYDGKNFSLLEYE